MPEFPLSCWFRRGYDVFFFIPFFFPLFPWIFSADEVFMEDLVPARSHVSLVRSIGSEEPCLPRIR